MNKQIEEMAKVLYENRPYKDLWEEDAIEIAKVLYNAGYRKQTEGEWISVEDRLPKDGETVLTISSEEEFAVCFYETEWEGIFQQCHGLIKIYNITHWMPLPKPPQMKGGEKE